MRKQRLRFVLPLWTPGVGREVAAAVMLGILVTVALAASGALLPVASDVRPISTDTLKVLTYNLHGLLDNKNPPDWDPVRAARLVDEIETLDPDIVGFQEVLQDTGSDRSNNQLNNQLRALADSLAARTGSPWEFRVAMAHISWDRFEEGVGILSKHPIIESKEYSLTAKDVFRRNLLASRIATPLGTVGFYTTHLAHRDEAESTRVSQVNHIRKVITSRAEEAHPTILVGDFNAEPGSRSINLLTEGDSAGTFIDVFQFLHPGDAGLTYPASDPRRRIDYVFITDATKLKPVRAEIIFDEVIGEIYLSDHLGVYAEFERGRPF